MQLQSLTHEALGNWLSRAGYGPYFRDVLFAGLYRKLATSVEDIPHLRADWLKFLQDNATLVLPSIHRETLSDDGTLKYLLALPDGKLVETVLMRFKGRATVCISTQAGCAMGCVFCATGQMGFERHLTAAEIVSQVVHAQRVLGTSHEKLRNIVLMGMGEPLHNYDAVMTAIDIVQDHKGLGIGPRFITLSTVGLVPGIRRLADDARKVMLAVSLHAATDEERNRLVPIGRQWPLAELMEACREYSEKKKVKVFFEWALIEGRNDTEDQAHALGKWLVGMQAHVNVIPLNPTRGFDGLASHEGRTAKFREILFSYGIPSTQRQRRGLDIDAGCGQLKSKELRERKASRDKAATA